MNQLGQGRFRAYSAGGLPRGEVHPLTLSTLAEQDYPTAGLEQQTLGGVRRAGCASHGFCVHRVRPGRRRSLPGVAGPADDRALGICRPGCPGQATTRRRRARRLPPRWRKSPPAFACFSSLPLDKLDRLSLQAHLRELGRPA